MIFDGKTLNALLADVSNVEDTNILETHKEVLKGGQVDGDEQAKSIANTLITVTKGVMSQGVVTAGHYDLEVKAPTVRAYLFLDDEGKLPSVKVTVSSTPSNKFSFKEVFEARYDENFKDTFTEFLGDLSYSYFGTAIANENVAELNGLLQEVKDEIETDELAVPFELEFALHDRPVKYVSNDKLVLGTSFEEISKLASPNSLISIVFNYTDDTKYVADSIKEKLKEDWVSSPNPLAFIRKHNTALTPFIVGNLSTRRTHRADTLVKKSITLVTKSLKNRKSALAHEITKDGDDAFISVWEKVDSDAEPVQILSPVNIKSLVYQS